MNLSSILNRIKAELNIKQDQEFAKLLGITSHTLAYSR